MTFVSGSAQVASENSNLLVTAPPGLVVGNLLVAAVGMNQATPGISPPAVLPGFPTWTLVDSFASTSGIAGMSVWTKPVTVSEPTSYIFTGGSWLGGVVLQYVGVLDGGVAWAEFDNNDTSSETVTVPAETPSTATDTWLVVIYTALGMSATAPAGFTPRAAADGANIDGIFASDLVLTSAASTGTTTATVTPSDDGVVVTVLLQPTGLAPAATYVGTPGVIPIL